MKNNADRIRSLLLGLLEYFSSSDFSPSGKVDQSEKPASEEATFELLNPSCLPAMGTSVPAEGESVSTFNPDISTVVSSVADLGELLVVQDHFQAVLKRRLQVEVSQKPPLFPWESVVKEYPVELSESNAFVWLSQMRSLKLPTELPEDILVGLLQRCQEVLLETLQPGMQLVKVVENLFPDQPQAMDQIAGLVLANATFRGTTTRDLEQLKTAFPDGYDGANPQQQVTLTMLAAKDILEALTLSLSPIEPVLQRSWITTQGDIMLSLRYQPGNPDEINISVQVPQAAQLHLPTVGQTVTQNRPGTLHLTLTAPAANVAYPLEVHFSQLDTVPLTFIVRWTMD
jgi:hypothetical protein